MRIYGLFDFCSKAIENYIVPEFQLVLLQSYDMQRLKYVIIMQLVTLPDLLTAVLEGYRKHLTPPPINFFHFNGWALVK